MLISPSCLRHRWGGLRHRWGQLLALALSAVVLGACGSDSDDAPSSSGGGPAGASSTSSEQDSARLRLTQCLRENGVDVPDDPGPGLGVDPDELREALGGPCKGLQAGAFGDHGGAADQEFQDAFQRFAQCMRDNGIEVPDFDPNAGPTQIHGLFDPDDPKAQAAGAKCQDALGQGAGGP